MIGATSPLQRARRALPGWRWPTAVGVGALLLTAAALALFVAVFDWNAARGAIERAFLARTGRVLEIGGDLDVRLRRRPLLIAHDVRVANPDWAQRADLLTARRVTLALSLPSLLRGAVALHALELEAPRLALEQRDGLRTWAFGKEGTGRPLPIGHLRIDDGLVEFLDPAARTAVTAAVTARGDRSAEAVAVSARGTWRGEPFRLDARGPSVLGLLDRTTPYPLVAHLQTGATQARFDGTVTGLPAPSALDATVALSGENLEHLERILAVAIPATPPYALRGRLRREGTDWRLDEATGRIGDTDVRGRFAYHAGPRPRLALEVASDRLDFDDLGPLIGAPPRTIGETASPGQRAEAERMKRRGQALPDKPFAASAWQRMDVDFTLSARRVVHPPALPIQSLETTLRVRDGVLRLEPIRMQVAGGQVDGQVELDGRRAPLQGAMELRFRRLALRELFPTVEAMRDARGLAHGRARLAGAGRSVAELLGAANGRISLAVDSGTISQRVLELMGLDIAESALLLATGDREIALRCAVADLQVRRGIATSEVLVIDTTDTLVVGSGVIDLAAERLDLTVHPRPKDASPLAARTALHIRGPLRDPSITPDAKGLAARGVTAALLALVNPLLALAPFIETGPGGDSDCAGLLARARQWAGSTAPKAQR